jgi:hypothetical protein
MTISIKIDSVKNIPIEEMNNILEYICEDIMTSIIENKYEDMKFNYILKSRKQKKDFKKIKEGDEIIGTECSICFDKFKKGQYKRELNCKHDFHKKCIDKWSKENNSCPICRSEI